MTNDKQIPWKEKGAVNGVATLGADGKLTSTQMPAIKTINGKPILGSGDLTVSTSLYKIVDALPTTDVDITKIYLVPATNYTAKNNKTEYIYLGDPNKAYDETKWEKLGEEPKSTNVDTSEGTIVIDMSLDKTSTRPIANKPVAEKIEEIVSTLNGKVAQGDYDTAMTTVNSKLKALENNTITVDTELKDSVNPVQNKAVNSAVQGLEAKINGKADTTALKSATDRITALENNGATGVTVTENGEGNGIASIKNVGKNIVATKGTFLTQHQSLVGYATTATMNTELAKKAEKEHTHSQYALASALDNYVLNSALANYVTDTTLTTKLADYATQGWITEQEFAKTSAIPINVSDLNNDSGFLTSQSLAGYVNDVKITEVTNGNGIASISKKGSSLNVIQGTFVTKDSLNGYWNKLSIFRTGNGIADIWVDNTNKSEICINRRDFVTPETLGTSIDEYASDKGYLTKENIKENMKETVVIKLVSDKSESDTNLNGVTVTVKSGDTTVSTQTWQGSPISVEVPCDKEVTIEAGVKKMYIKPKVLKYVPSPLYNREVTLTYKALETGVFIIDTNDNLINKDSWSPTMKQTTVGVALITEKVAIVISTGLTTDLCWSKTNQLVGGVTTTTDSATAIQDFKGKANTEAIVKALGQNAPAAYYCSNYTFKNGKKGYLMATGESQEIFVNMQKISELLNYINTDTTNLNNGFEIWTSTQKNESMAWCHDGMSRKTLSKTVDNNYVVPIYSLYD